MIVDKSKIWCVVPSYNNKNTLKGLVLDCRKYVDNILVVDDGSFDADVSVLLEGCGAVVLKHPRNMGKGKAILTAVEYLRSKSAEFVITIDADGQHKPADINNFLPLLDHDTILAGCRDFSAANVPGKSKFGRKFSNFWFKVETGASICDSQSGFRAYPFKYLALVKFFGRRYEFEVEVITRAVWAGLKIKDVPIDVWYPPPAERVSSFHVFYDNLRISLAHCRLIGRRLLPWPHKLLAGQPKNNNFDLFQDPKVFFSGLLKENATPMGLAASAFTGVFIGTLPILSFHSVTIIYVTSRLHLNKIMALAIQNISNPPLVPVMCIELGYYIYHGRWLTEVSWKAVFGNIPARVCDWFIGSLIVAPVLAFLAGIIVYIAAARSQKKRNAPELSL
jgi:glycosyltransferase involved in cell wall biosynthesis